MTTAKLYGNSDAEYLRLAREYNTEVIRLIGIVTDGRPLSGGQTYHVLAQIAVALGKQKDALAEMDTIRRTESGRSHRFRREE